MIDPGQPPIVTSPTALQVIGKYAYDFYQCAKCHRLITQPAMLRALGPEGTGCACPCGGLKYSPRNLGAGWIYPRVWAFAWQRARELGWSGIWTNLKADWAHVWDRAAESVE